LPKICSLDKIPFVSGLGVALGYIGTLLALFSAMVFVAPSQYHAIFIPTAVLFFLFALPSFIIIKIPHSSKNVIHRKNHSFLKEGISQFISTISSLKRNKHALNFFIAIMLAMNGINCILLNIGVYGKKVLGFQDAQLPLFIGFGAIFAFLSGLFFGIITKRNKAKFMLSLILCGWVVILIFTSLVVNKDLFWIMGPCFGILLAGTWTVSRPFIIQLAPKERIGEFFGFTALASVSGTLFGPLLWLLIISCFDSFGVVKYRIAVFSLSIVIAISIFVLQKVPQEKIV